VTECFLSLPSGHGTVCRQQSLLRQPCIHSVEPWKLIYSPHLSHHLLSEHNMFLTMLGDIAVFWLYVTLICSFLHYITLKAAFEKFCRLIRLIWSPLLPFVYSIVSIRSIWICVRLLHCNYSEHDSNARVSRLRAFRSVWFRLKMGKKMVVSPADETCYCFKTTCFIGRWGNVKYSVWLRNQLKLVSLCFMYYDDDDVPVLHDFIQFHYQYPAFFSYSAIGQA